MKGNDGPKGKNKRKSKAYKSSCVGRISGASLKSLGFRV